MFCFRATVVRFVPAWVPYVLFQIGSSMFCSSVTAVRFVSDWQEHVLFQRGYCRVPSLPSARTRLIGFAEHAGLNGPRRAPEKRNGRIGMGAAACGSRPKRTPGSWRTRGVLWLWKRAGQARLVGNATAPRRRRCPLPRSRPDRHRAGRPRHRRLRPCWHRRTADRWSGRSLRQAGRPGWR